MNSTDLPNCLSGPSTLAGEMRAYDWSTSSLGAPATWPTTLQSTVQLMLGSAFPMFLTWGDDGAMLYNDGYAELLGDKRMRALGRPLLEVWSEISADLQPLIDRVAEGQAVFLEDLALTVRRHDHSGALAPAWFTFSYSPLRLEHGEVAGLFCTVIETTANVQARRAVIDERGRLQTLFSQTPGFVAILRGSDHRFEFVNADYRRMVGGRDVVGRSVREAFPEVVSQGFIQLLDNVLASGTAFRGESARIVFDAEPQDGRAAAADERYLDFIYQPLVDGAGRVDGIFVHGHDVTEQHRAREALKVADRKKDEFLATLAHELRNPLAPIRSAAALLALPAVGVPARDRAVQVIERQVGQMARLLDDLLDVARITERRLVLKKERLALADVVEIAMETAQPLAGSRRHTLTARVHDGGLHVMADPVRLEQILSNLLNNACKYTDRGGTIALDVRADGAWAEMAVTDNGMGIAPEALGGIFDMFSQVQSAIDRSEGGLGIGLSLVKGLAELHGGTLTAASDGPGRGSCFTLRLPLVEGFAADMEVDAKMEKGTVSVSEPAGAVAGSGRDAPGEGAAGAGQSVLLADDNVDAAELLAEVLRLSGHTVRLAHDGLGAVRAAEALRPDVLVLDIGMPGMNGYEVARRIRAESWGARPVIIAATGWGQASDRVRSREAGFDHHITKPFEPDELIRLFRLRAEERTG